MAPATVVQTAGVRPTGATVISIIEGILGALGLVAALLLIVGMGVVGGLVGSQADVDNAAGLGALFAGLGIVFGIIVLLIAILYIAIAYGVWKGRRWAWTLGVVVSVISIVFGVLGLAGNVSLFSLIQLALPIVVIYYLWQPDVKRWLGRPA
jgi:hypothetical protein